MNETNPVKSALRGKKILWVEDDSLLNYIISQKLAHEEISLFVAVEGQEALRYAKDEKPDIIVLDVMLPNMDGLEILTRLKEDPATKDIPVFVFSNLDDKDKIDKIMKLGAESFFLKATMSLDDILAMVNKNLSKQ